MLPSRHARAWLALALLSSCRALEDALHSSCYIHFRSLGRSVGLTDCAVRLCNVALFAAVHNCTAVVPFFSETAARKHATTAAASPGGLAKVSLARYLDLRSSPDIPPVQEASWPWTLLRQECRCKGGRRPPCPGAMRCPRLLGKAWRWRSYDSLGGLKDLVRRLQLDMRRKEPGLRVYSYGLGTDRFNKAGKAALGGLSVQAFLRAAAAAAVDGGLSGRRDLLQRFPAAKGRGHVLLPGREARTCDARPSAEVERYVEEQVAGALGGAPFAHLWLRRGDMAGKYGNCSAPANVARGFLLKMGQARPRPWPTALLVNSNEREEGYWRELLQALKGAFGRVVTERELPNPHGADNYFAYAAAPAFARRAAFALHFHPITVGGDGVRQEMCPEGL